MWNREMRNSFTSLFVEAASHKGANMFYSSAESSIYSVSGCRARSINQEANVLAEAPCSVRFARMAAVGHAALASLLHAGHMDWPLLCALPSCEIPIRFHLQEAATGA